MGKKEESVKTLSEKGARKQASLPQLLVLNGSPSGKRGNCAKALIELTPQLEERFSVQVVDLKNVKLNTKLRRQIEQADGFLFMTGTYWDSWGSPLQKFLEWLTPLEGTVALLGKPVGVVVLMHAVGGKAVLSRLQGALNTMGCMVPPMTGAALSLAQSAASRIPNKKHSQDFWTFDDLTVVIENLRRAANGKKKYLSWTVDRKDYQNIWWEK